MNWIWTGQDMNEISLDFLFLKVRQGNKFSRGIFGWCTNPVVKIVDCQNLPMHVEDREGGGTVIFVWETKLKSLLKMFSYFVGIDFKIKTVELGGKKIKLQIW